jgi:hypothetical protein
VEQYRHQDGQWNARSNDDTGVLGVEGKGKAPHWRLTELGCLGAFPTRDFERWDSSKFVDRKSKSRAPFPARGVPENRHGGVLENRATEANSVPESTHIAKPMAVREKRHITSLPYTVAANVAAQSPKTPATGPDNSPLRKSVPRRVRTRIMQP